VKAVRGRRSIKVGRIVEKVGLELEEVLRWEGFVEKVGLELGMTTLCSFFWAPVSLRSGGIS